jgi:hypothetical protein
MNLYLTYMKVRQRIRRASDERCRVAAEEAADAARKIIESPTLKRVASFRRCEDRWLSYAGARARSLADEFESAIRSGTFTVERPILSTRYAGWKPKTGTVYCLSCDDMPGCVKIGATTQSARDRAALLAKRYSLSGVTVFFSLLVDDPSAVEERAQLSVEHLRVRGPKGSKSNEWFRLGQRSAIRVLKEAASPSGAA